MFNSINNNNNNKRVLQEGPRLEIPKRATRSREAASRVEGPSEPRSALVVLVCGPSESRSRWTKKNYFKNMCIAICKTYKLQYLLYFMQ